MSTPRDRTLIELIEPLARMFFGEPNRQLSSEKELRFGTHGSLCVDLVKGTWFDHEKNEGGGTVDLIKRSKGFTDSKSCFAWLRAEGLWENGRTKGNGCLGKEVVAYDYSNEVGDLAYQVVRFEPKTFRQRRPDGNGGWIWNIKGIQPVPYRLPELIEAVASDHIVVIVEGEKDVDNLWKIGVPATTNAMGAGKWKLELDKYFANADVVLVPDNDDTGYKHVQEVGAALTGIAKRVRVLVLPGLPPKGDVSDWLTAGGTREQFDVLVEQAPAWLPTIPATDETDKSGDKAKAQAAEQKIIDELARLDRVGYERRRSEAARGLGIRRGALDDEVEARRAEQREQAGPAPLFGHWVVEPWPDPVDPAELLEGVTRQICRYSVIPDHLAHASAMWTQIGWNLDIATHSPILLIGSSDPNSGKTTLLDVLGFLVRRPLSTVGISEAALFRSIERWEPGVLIDEGDDTFKQNESGLKALINSVWTRGKYVLRCVGDDLTPHPFPTFCSLAFAMNGKRIPASTKSRSIEIWMMRKLSTETCEPFDHLDNPTFAALRQQSLRFALDHGELLRAAMKKTHIPKGMDGRAAENFRLPFAIADLAGKGWVERVRKAAEKITGTMDVSTRNTRLLGAIKRVFDAKCAADEKAGFPSPDPGFIGSFGLIELLLKDDPEGEVRDWWKGKPIMVKQLGDVLRQYGISSTHNKTKDTRGYYCWQFEDAWGRYL